MSRINRWKLDKTKVKVVFRLQFHATHIPQSGWDKLFITFIPVDSGKATSKTTKANVRNGSCKWADPIYETTQLLQDIKTKQYDEKLYKFVISMGSSRSSILGESIINLADYADALRPSVVSLPLHGCDSGATLHVTVQLLTSKTGFREFEQQREVRERGLQKDQNSPDESSAGKLSYGGDSFTDHIDKANHGVRVSRTSKDLASRVEELGSRDESADSATGFDGSSNASESVYAEKHDTSSTHEIDSVQSAMSGDVAAVGRSPQVEKGDHSEQQISMQGTSDWVRSCNSDFSMDNDLSVAFEENSRLRGNLELAESCILELQTEVRTLQSHADQIGYEAQEFAKQLAAEIASGEKLTKEVSVLKSECSELKDQLEKLKPSKLSLLLNSEVAVEAGQDGIQDLQLTWLKGLIIMEDKIREVQKKACFGYHDTGLGSLNSDLEALLSSLEILKQKTGLSLSSVNWIPNMEESEKMGIYKNQKFATGTGLDVDLNPPDIGMLPCLNIPALISQETNSVDANDALKGKVFELLRDLDESKSERESLVKKMNEMECYYEALVQELEENQRQMVGELQNLRNEHSTCLYTISSHKADMEAMHHDLNNRMLRLAEDKLALETLNNELERRAVSAEAALKRARLNYSIAVDQLQKDLELLSSQVVSMFETNENLIRQAFIDFSQQNQQALPDIVSGYKFNSRDIQTMKLVEFQNQFVGINNQHSSGDNLLNDIKRSLHLQEGVYRKVEEEVHDLHFVNVYLDVFSKVLQETLLEAHGDKKLTNKKITELVQQIGVLTDAKEILMQKLHAAMDDIRSLDQSKAICIAECNDLALENQNLKSSIHKAAVENQLLLQKLNEWESLVVQCEGYQSKYETCAAEKTELAYLLEMRCLENDNLQNENVALQEQLKTVKAEFDDLASKKENMQNSLTFAQNILQKLLAAQDERFDKLPKLQEYGSRETDIAAVLVQLEERQNTASDKFLQLIEENKGLVLERDNAQISIATLESEIVSLKNKFRHEMHNMVCKFDMSNKWVEKLQLDIESLAERLQRGEVEENFTCHQNGLLSYLDHLEVELQDIISKNRNIAPEFVDLEIIELEKSKSTVEELTNECQELRNRLHEKTEESSRLASELQNLKESFQLLRGENHVLMASSDDKLQEYTQLVSECKNLKDSLLSLQEENQSLAESSKSKSKKAAKLELELQSLKEELQHLHDDNNTLVASSRDNTEESLKLSSELRSLKDSFQSLSDEKVALIAMSQSKTEEAASLALELKGLKDSLQSLHDQNEGLMACLKEKDEEALKLSSEVSRLEQTLQSLHDENQVLVVRYTEKSEESAKHEAEIISLRERLQSLLDENQVLVARSTEKSKESADHEAEIISLRERLQSLVDENQVLVARSTKKLEESANHEAEIISLRERLQSLLDDNQVLVAHTTEKLEESSKQEAEIVSLRERLQSLLDENQVLVARYAEKLEESAKHEAEMISLRERMQSLLDENQVLVARSTEKSEESAKHEEEIISLTKRLQSLFEENQVLVARSREKSEESAKHETEIIRLSEHLRSLLDENQALVASSVDKAKECAQLASDLNSSKVKLESLYNEMLDERNLRDELQNTNKDLTSELHLSQSQLEKCESQLAHFKQSVIDLQAEKARQSHLLSNYEEYLRSAHEKSFMISDLQTQLLELHELLIAAEIRLTFTESQLQNRVEELVQQLCQSETQIDELQKKYSHLESSHNSILDSEQQYLEEKAMLSTSLNTLKSELEASIAKNRLLNGTNQAIVMELEERKKKMLDMGLHQSEEKQQHSFEVEKLYQEIISSGEEIESLMLSNEAREVDIIILRAKLEEMQAQVSSMDEHHSEVVMLQKRCGELSQKLSDQVTKTEEFRNLSVHLKELKDEAEANYNQIREKRESEAAPAAPQESLRIAFIKEQYETRVQELQHQLSMSKRHGEEILLKLQDAIDEVENRRKSEVSYHKKTEELGMKILELEDELQSVLAGKREKMMAYDLMKAEKECSLISLECCKEEKQKLEVTLEELKEENAKLSAELATVKTSLEDLRSTLKVQEEEKQNLEASIQGLNEEISKLAGELTITKESLEQARSTAKEPGEENDESCSDESDSVTCRVANISSGSLSTSESTLWSKLDGSRDYKEAGSTCSATFIGVGIANALENVDGLQEILVPNGDTSPFASDGRLMDGEQKQQSDHLRAESLRSSLDHLNNELERMKNENSFTDDDHDFTEKFPGLERELAQLQKVNEELRGMFPSFNEISVNGNALERVLALEIELADALRTNKGSSIHFQSSFVKQHSDEEAVFKSFKDINELIKEMLEVKGRYADVETELKDMHDRYSKLSLQFAEVEGERQKLLMTLKNVRASKKGQQLNRTSSTTLEDHSPFP